MKRYFWVAICILIALVVVSCDDHVHTYSDEWTWDKDYHWHAATCEHKDAVKDKAKHIWDEGKITTPATADKAGVKTYTCTVCKATKEVELPLCEEHTMVKHEAKAATCTEKGWKAYEVCSVCGYSTYEEIAATGHDYKCVATANKAKHHKVCSNCNAIEAGSEEDHKYGEWKKVDDSRVKRTCSECKNVEIVEGVAVSTKDEFNKAINGPEKNEDEHKEESEEKIYEVKIYLTADIDLENSDPIDIEKKKIEIDFNGKTLTVKKRIRVKGSTLVLSGKGTIKTTSTGGDNSVFWLYGSTTDQKDYTILTAGEITIEGEGGIYIGLLNSNGGYYKSKDTTNGGKSYGVVVNLDGTTINTKLCGLYVQGLITEMSGNVPVFNLKNVKIKQDAGNATIGTDDDPTGIYAAGYAVWNIENSTVDGEYSSIEIRAGELNITSGTFTSSATEYKAEANGNGKTTKGAAIVVSQHTTKLSIKVEISGGEFSGFHAMAVQNPQKTDASSKVSVEVTGGKFTATNETVVNVEDTYFEISAGAKYDAPASFKVTAKTTT